MKPKNILLVLVLVLIGCFAYFFLTSSNFLGKISDTSKGEGVKVTLPKFSSEEEFKAYLEEAEELTSAYGGFFGASETQAAQTSIQTGRIEAIRGESKIPERVSSTNVQIKGIDEPDIVKTDGQRIYFSETKTNIIGAFPPEKLSILSRINETGNLFVVSNTLVILGNKIYGYDISNPESPVKKYSIEINGSIVGARLYKNKIYLVIRDYINYQKPCPIYPLSVNGNPVIVKCQDIYRPTEIIPVDVIYTAVIINPETGEIEKSLTFIGSSLSVVYMSKQALYITYTYYEDLFKIIADFLENECQDLLPSYIINKTREMKKYKISVSLKLEELRRELERYSESLSPEERSKLGEEFEARMKRYFEKVKRDIIKTGIIKIDLEKFDVSAVGYVPGKPLNQFSLDEYKGYLRIATTVGIGWNTENDVYVLDKDLKIVGMIQGLGVGERIYSVRFIGDRGYVVTFREIDPFYVIDLSDPTKPEVKGELKIPGYSSYLHPIDEHLILGIGKEGWKVKISLFDVSSASEPKEIDKYILNESWSEVLRNHHAFLLDKKHEIFFIPTTRGGYIFSYSGQKLELEKVIPTHGVRRAIYINDWLYVITRSKILVFDEYTWEKVNELKFD
ncbi:MAG TPA: hypothetical protein EYH09_01390 [Candidatus Nanopusillus sp.]|nr:hypothetical protein [Candidatus Nanopusillus sp.]